MSDLPGRVCPIRYRYGAAAIAKAPERLVDTLYVVGGLYGNEAALDAIETLAEAETVSPRICFNGDFNWFNVDERGFAEINRRVLNHDAIAGNVEAELSPDAGEAGCGCGYPDSVDGGVVERSNRIHARLSKIARTQPDIQTALARLPMFARYRIGACAVGVVHGDAEALAGWGFDPGCLDDPARQSWIADVFAQASVDVFASTHTCVPALRVFGSEAARRAVINNGAAGMPNFSGRLSGLVSRISIHPSPHPVLYGAQVRGLHVDAIELPYDHDAWLSRFIANWPEGSDAHVSYYARILGQLALRVEQAAPG